MDLGRNERVRVKGRKK